MPRREQYMRQAKRSRIYAERSHIGKLTCDATQYMRQAKRSRIYAEAESGTKNIYNRPRLCQKNLRILKNSYF